MIHRNGKKTASGLGACRESNEAGDRQPSMFISKKIENQRGQICGTFLTSLVLSAVISLGKLAAPPSYSYLLWKELASYSRGQTLRALAAAVLHFLPDLRHGGPSSSATPRLSSRTAISWCFPAWPCRRRVRPTPSLRKATGFVFCG